MNAPKTPRIYSADFKYATARETSKPGYLAEKFAQIREQQKQQAAATVVNLKRKKT